MASVITVQPASAHGVTAFLSQVADAAGKQKTPTVGAHQFIYVRARSASPTGRRHHVRVDRPRRRGLRDLAAAAKIPGVVLVKDATDAAGRHGEAIAHVSNGERAEYIFDHNTHPFLGERSHLIKNTPEGKAGMLTGTSAILTRAVVNKMGDLPAGTRA